MDFIFLIPELLLWGEAFAYGILLSYYVFCILGEILKLLRYIIIFSRNIETNAMLTCLNKINSLMCKNKSF